MKTETKTETKTDEEKTKMKTETKTDDEKAKAILEELKKNRSIRIANGFEKVKKDRIITYDYIVKSYNAGSMKTYSLNLDSSKTKISFRNSFINRKVQEIKNISKEVFNLVYLELLNTESDLIIDFDLWIKDICFNNKEKLLL